MSKAKEHRERIARKAAELNEAISEAFADNFLTYIHIEKACDLPWAAHVRANVKVESMNSDLIEAVELLEFHGLTIARKEEEK